MGRGSHAVHQVNDIDVATWDPADCFSVELEGLSLQTSVQPGVFGRRMARNVWMSWIEAFFGC